MAMHERKMIDLEQGWEFMQKGITKLKNILEGLPEPQFRLFIICALINLLMTTHNSFMTSTTSHFKITLLQRKKPAVLPPSDRLEIKNQAEGITCTEDHGVPIGAGVDWII
ncbi:hypothetical protein IFM89_009627 [Coptis chinensis]|uniref:Uncharacterized protein n=1 Tax=Coptis chinensis TaxID=261450 RepID=A0A835IVV2_9MAGN|nr:hypothetical protein IFM89_009627 [Coptis chinensis]